VDLYGSKPCTLANNKIICKWMSGQNMT
jgi:hypothetical protein